MQDTQPNKYLGLPSLIGRSKKQVFNEIKERVGKKLSGWKEKLLSIGGREILIKAVAQALPTYTMGCFLLPKGLCEDLERMMRNFWWGQRHHESKIAWVSWSKICKSKLEGGMGFRDLQAFNLAMLAKQGWWMMSHPSSLMARVYKARYFPNNDVLSATLGSSPSFAWRSIHQSLEVLKQGTRWRVRNGKTIHIWDDKWLPTPSTYKVISPQIDFGDFPMVSALIDQDTRRWRRDRLERIFLAFEVEIVLGIPISYHLPDDQLIWVGNKKGIFSVKSAYYVARKVLEGSEQGESSLGDVRAPLWKKMWHLNIPAKVRIFAWRLCMNAIPTMRNLNKRGVRVDPLCPLCSKEAEFVEHAILKCEIAKKVWENWIDCPISLLEGRRDFSDIALDILRQGTQRDLEIFFWVAWMIW